MVIGAVISCGGLARNTGAICPGLETGTTILCSTVSIQNVAFMLNASALGAVTAGLPSRKAILAVPPPNSGAAGAVETVKTIVLVMVWPAMASRRTVFGSVKIAWVIVPAAMNLVRSWGIRGVSVFAAVWLMKVMNSGGLLPMMKGVMLTAGMVGGPLMEVVGAKVWALIVVPCGIDAIRTRELASTGVVVVAGIFIHRPGSK